MLISFYSWHFSTFFWVAGGKWAFASAIPTDMDGKMILKPGPLATFLVELGLLFFALINNTTNKLDRQLTQKASES